MNWIFIKVCIIDVLPSFIGTACPCVTLAYEVCQHTHIHAQLQE